MTNEEAIKTIEAAVSESEWEYPMEYAAAFEKAIAVLKNDAVPVVHGHWEEKIDENADSFFRRKFSCSACCEWQTYGETKFCPFCGAKMDEVD